MIALDRSSPVVEDRPQHVACSQAQQRFWFEEQLHPGNPGLNVAVRWQLEGDLSDEVLAAAWDQLTQRHAALRTSFMAIDGQPMGIVEPRVDLPVRTVDLRALEAGERVAQAERLADIEAHTTFDLAAAPLIRVTRIVLSEQRSIVLVTAHHVICDGWSIGILAHEMGQLCAALSVADEPTLPDLPLEYGDYAAWERECALSGSLENEIALARTYLRNYTQFELLPDRPRPPLQTSNGNITSLLLDRSLTDGLVALARANGCTLFVAALASLFALLHRYSGETDIILGTQVAGRDDEDLEGIVGCFINTIALRGDISGDPSFTQLVERTRDSVSETFELRQIPLERLIEVVKPQRDLSRNALFSVNFIFQRSFIKNSTYGAVRLVDLPSRSSGALYDLNIFMVERPEGWRVSCEYNTDLFDRATIDGLLERFSNVLRAVGNDPQQAVSQLPIVSASDRQASIVRANQAQAEYPHDRTLPELFADQAAHTPGALAIRCGETALTYAELQAASNRLATQLRGRGIARGMRVGVLLERGVDLVVALLAVTQAGAAYVPLDPAYPDDRLHYVMTDAQLSAVVTHVAFENRVSSTTLCIAIDDAASSERYAQASALEPPAPDDIAYVIYTSGSTGLPKGVQVGHRALVNLLWAMRAQPGIAAHDTLVAVTTMAFDIAALEFFVPLISGATLVIAKELDVTDGNALIDLLRRSGATIVQATPVTWQLLIDAGWNGEPHLKALCGGEALPRALAEQLLDRGAELWNMYGPTETTIWSSALRVERGTGPVPLGPPIANTQFYVLDAYGNPVAPGVAGELHIGGDGVALGYFNRPELTAERFVPNPFARAPETMYRTGDIVRARERGTFEFLGRADGQIKLRGFRIELGEIESALTHEAGVAAAVVGLSADAGGDRALYAYVVPQPGTHPTAAWLANLRVALATFLPAYMLPSAIVAIDALPRTPNGKIDRRLLGAPDALATESAERDDRPQTPVEMVLSELVATLLRRVEIGRSQDLFALGFHSLLAVRLVAQIVQTFGVKLPLRALFDHPNVASLAQRIVETTASVGAELPQSITAFNAEGARTPFVFFHNDVWSGGMYVRRLAAIVGPPQPVLAIAPHGTAGLASLPTIEAMAADYLERLLRVQPQGPYRIGGFCAGGLVAYELARLLHARGESVELLVLVNASAPPRRNVLCGDALLRGVGLNARLAPVLREVICWNAVRLFDAIGHGPKTTRQFIRKRVRALFRLRDDARITGRMNPRYLKSVAGRLKQKTTSQT